MEPAAALDQLENSDEDQDQRPPVLEGEFGGNQLQVVQKKDQADQQQDQPSQNIATGSLCHEDPPLVDIVTYRFPPL
jgi:hypothetical protein